MSTCTRFPRPHPQPPAWQYTAKKVVTEHAVVWGTESNAVNMFCVRHFERAHGGSNIPTSSQQLRSADHPHIHKDPSGFVKYLEAPHIPYVISSQDGLASFNVTSARRTKGGRTAEPPSPPSQHVLARTHPRAPSVRPRKLSRRSYGPRLCREMGNSEQTHADMNIVPLVLGLPCLPYSGLSQSS
jgi:hypothetical protein